MPGGIEPRSVDSTRPAACVEGDDQDQEHACPSPSPSALSRGGPPSSRGIGADTARYLAQAGANVVINFRNKAPRAEKLAAELRGLGVEVLVVGADLTDPASVAEMFRQVGETFGSLDLLVLNASGGMEAGMAEDYALTLNRDAQVNVLDAALPLMHEDRGHGGSRVVFVTSHQAHFIRTTPTMPERPRRSDAASGCGPV